MVGWRTGGVEIGDLRRLTGAFEGRIGNSWARGRLRRGDLLVAIRHSGDCFHDYLLLEHGVVEVKGRQALQITPVLAPIGAYVLGEPAGSLERHELALASFGKTFTINLPEWPEIEEDPRVAVLGQHVREQALSNDPGFGSTASRPRIHDWRSHVGPRVAGIWAEIPWDMRLAIAADAEDAAGREEHE